MRFADTTGWETSPTPQKLTLIAIPQRPRAHGKHFAPLVGSNAAGRTKRTFEFPPTCFSAKSDRFRIYDDNQVLNGAMTESGRPVWTHTELLKTPLPNSAKWFWLWLNGMREVRFVKGNALRGFPALALYMNCCGTMAIDFDCREARPGNGAYGITARNYASRLE